jgi:DNA-binding transcriptional LysR family regulator
MSGHSPRCCTVLLSASVLLNRMLARGKFRQVQVLLKLAELGSMQGTADAIGIPQASVTQALAELEDLLETKLFQRQGCILQPTQGCAALLPHARQVMWGVTESAESLAAHLKQGRTLVRVLAWGQAANGLVVKALPAFVERYPQVEVQVGEAQEEDLLQAIARGEVDLVACRRPPVVPQGWGFRELQPDRFAVVCAPDHPLATGRRVRWEELSRQVWLLPPAGSAARDRFESLTARTRRERISYGVITHVPAMSWWLLYEHDLIAFAPFSVVRELVEQGDLVEVPTDDQNREEPLGLLQPHSGGEAALRLSGFLAQQFAPTPDADEDSGDLRWTLHQDASPPAHHPRH